MRLESGSIEGSVMNALDRGDARQVQEIQLVGIQASGFDSSVPYQPLVAPTPDTDCHPFREVYAPMTTIQLHCSLEITWGR